MAANFWASSHCNRWLLEDKHKVYLSNRLDTEFFGSKRLVWATRLFFTEFLGRLGRKLKFRQRVISTAIIFFKRFYLDASFVEFDPALVAPTLLFLAAKVEECALNAKTFVSVLSKMDFPVWNYKMDDMLECEFYCLHYLTFDLIVYHPYRPLQQYLSEMGMDDVAQCAWEIVNDSYRTDVSLVYPPYLIAIAAIYMACNFTERDYRPWLRKLNVQLDQILDITKELLNLYDHYETLAASCPSLPPSTSTSTDTSTSTSTNTLNSHQYMYATRQMIEPILQRLDGLYRKKSASNTSTATSTSTSSSTTTSTVSTTSAPDNTAPVPMEQHQPAPVTIPPQAPIPVSHPSSSPRHTAQPHHMQMQPSQQQLPPQHQQPIPSQHQQPMSSQHQQPMSSQHPQQVMPPPSQHGYPTSAPMPIQQQQQSYQQHPQHVPQPANMYEPSHQSHHPQPQQYQQHIQPQTQYQPPPPEHGYMPSQSQHHPSQPYPSQTSYQQAPQQHPYPQQQQPYQQPSQHQFQPPHPMQQQPMRRQ